MAGQRQEDAQVRVPALDQETVARRFAPRYRLASQAILRQVETDLSALSRQVQSKADKAKPQTDAQMKAVVDQAISDFAKSPSHRGGLLARYITVSKGLGYDYDDKGKVSLDQDAVIGAIGSDLRTLRDDVFNDKNLHRASLPGTGRDTVPVQVPLEGQGIFSDPDSLTRAVAEALVAQLNPLLSKNLSPPESADESGRIDNLARDKVPVSITLGEYQAQAGEYTGAHGRRALILQRRD